MKDSIPFLSGQPLLNIYKNLDSESDRTHFLQHLNSQNQAALLQELRQKLVESKLTAIELQERGDESFAFALAIIEDPQLLDLCTPSTLYNWGIKYKEVALKLLQTNYSVTGSTKLSWALQHEEVALLLTQSHDLQGAFLVRVGEQWPNVRKLILETESLRQMLTPLQRGRLAQPTTSSSSLRKTF